MYTYSLLLAVCMSPLPQKRNNVEIWDLVGEWNFEFTIQNHQMSFHKDGIYEDENGYYGTWKLRKTNKDNIREYTSPKDGLWLEIDAYRGKGKNLIRWNYSFQLLRINKHGNIEMWDETRTKATLCKTKGEN